MFETGGARWRDREERETGGVREGDEREKQRRWGYGTTEEER